MEEGEIALASVRQADGETKLRPVVLLRRMPLFDDFLVCGVSTQLRRFMVAKYALRSAVLPRITDTVPFAERIRLHLMGIHRKLSGGDPEAVSPLFSGKAPDGRPAKGHEHVFLLPLDEDGDGRIDHLMVDELVTSPCVAPVLQDLVGSFYHEPRHIVYEVV